MRILAILISIFCLSQSAVASSNSCFKHIMWYANSTWNGPPVTGQDIQDTIFVCADTISLKGFNCQVDSVIWNNSVNSEILLVNQSGWYTASIYTGAFFTDVSVYVKIKEFDAELDSIIQLPACLPPFELNALSNITGFVGDTFLLWGAWIPSFGGFMYGETIYDYDDQTQQFTDIVLMGGGSLQPLLYNVHDTLQLAVSIFDEQCAIKKYCTLIPSIQAPIDRDICLVTVDENSGKHKVVWNNQDNDGIEQYRIYKQDGLTSNYLLISEISADSLSEYVDQTSLPEQMVSRYKLTITDSCNHESAFKNPHVTILLSSNLGINNTVNLNWNAYEGFDYPNFEIWRSPDGSNFSLLSMVANNTFAFVDVNPLPVGYYQIRVTNPNSCVSSRNSYSGSVSNTVDNTGNPAANILGTNQLLDIQMFPNPSHDILNIQLAQWNDKALVTIYTSYGVPVLQKEFEAGRNQAMVSVDKLAAGLYVARFTLGKYIVHRKFVISHN